jgi:hypothetical protein
MPILIAPLLGLLVGLVFAWAAREELARSERGALASQATLPVAAFGLLVHAPVTGYFLTYAPDWSLAYLFDSQRLPALVTVGAALLTAGTPLLGFAIMASPASRRRSSIVLRAGAVLLGTIIATASVLGGRWARDATFAQFHGDFGTRSLAGSELGHVVLWMNAVFVLAVVWMLWSLRRFTKNHPRR